MGWAMRRFPAGSFGWLLCHELRLGMRGGKKPLRTKIIALLLFVGMVALGCLAAQGLRDVPLRASPLALAIVLTASIGLFSFMTTQAVLGAQRTLYETGDLDLLFSAPLRQRTVLLAKLCGIAGNVTVSYAFLLLPFVVPIAAVNHPGLFGVLLLLVALALTAACLGLAITLVLARIAGPRAARTVGQIAAAILGGALFLGSQMLPHDHDDRRSGLMLIFAKLNENGFASRGLGSWPGRAAFGDPIALLVVLGGAIALFALTGIAFRRLFFRGFQDAGTRLSRARASRRSIARHFRPGLFGAVFAKEFTLLKRDPALAFQIVLRLVYLMPLMLLAFRQENGPPLAPSLAFLSVLIAGQLVGSFAWLAVAAEDTPDLIKVAPVEKAAIDRVKLLSALTMAAPLSLLLPIAIAVLETIPGAVVTVAMTALGGSAAGWLELKLGKPMPRKTFARRRSGSIVVGILTMVVTAIFGGIAALAIYFGI